MNVHRISILKYMCGGYVVCKLLYRTLSGVSEDRNVKVYYEAPK